MHARKMLVAVATAVFMLIGQMPATAQAEVECPADVSGNECEYYKDGFMAGAEDGKAGMSMAYERHADSYDSRFEPYFQAGYELGWSENR